MYIYIYIEPYYITTVFERVDLPIFLVQCFWNLWSNDWFWLETWTSPFRKLSALSLTSCDVNLNQIISSPKEFSPQMKTPKAVLKSNIASGIGACWQAWKPFNNISITPLYVIVCPCMSLMSLYMSTSNKFRSQKPMPFAKHDSIQPPTQTIGFKPVRLNWILQG